MLNVSNKADMVTLKPCNHLRKVFANGLGRGRLTDGMTGPLNETLTRVAMTALPQNLLDPMLWHAINDDRVQALSTAMGVSRGRNERFHSRRVKHRMRPDVGRQLHSLTSVAHATQHAAWAEKTRLELPGRLVTHGRWDEVVPTDAHQRSDLEQGQRHSATVLVRLVHTLALRLPVSVPCHGPR